MKIRSLVTLALLLSGCARDEYGYVARLGTDTITVEWITRAGNTVVSDVVERSPRVMRKHWEASLDNEGRLTRWVMDQHIANPRPGEPRDYRFTAEYAVDSVLVRESSAGQTRVYVIDAAATVAVPWESSVYGLYDLLFATALRQSGDTVPVRQYLPGQGVGRGVVRKHSADSITFVTTGLAGTGSARVDAGGRMASYSGRFTTDKQEVERITQAPDLDAIAERFAASEKANPARSLSTRDTLRATIGSVDIIVDYGRPLRRGRNILGDVVPYDAVWRTGANAATQLTVSQPLRLAGIALAPATYTLWTIPARDGAQLIVNRQSGQWGTRYNARMDLARAPLQVQALRTPVDTFTIRVEPRGTGAMLVLEWDRFRWSAPLVPADRAPGN